MNFDPDVVYDYLKHTFKPKLLETALVYRLREDEELIEGHLQEEDEDEEKDEDIYRGLLPHRDDHVLCNFAISCVYKGNASVSSSMSTGVDNGWSGLGRDQVEALNTLQMIIDLQIQAPMSRAAL